MLKQGDDLVAALDAVRAEEGRLGESRITSCGYFLQSSVCQNAKSRRPHPKLCWGTGIDLVNLRFRKSTLQDSVYIRYGAILVWCPPPSVGEALRKAEV